MTSDDLGPLCAAPAGTRIAYGPDEFQFGELDLPAGAGPYPVLVNVHGGVWLAQYGIDHSRAQAQALAASGFAVWNVEYRRVGNRGGGWPGTFLDVGRAADFVRVLAARYPLDRTRIVLMGHSAGGLLALWLAARARLPAASPLHVGDPIAVRGVVALAPACDLPALHAQGVHGGVVDALLGGSPAQVPERYDWITPARLIPIGVRQHVIVGHYDAQWRAHGEAYAAAARARDDGDVQLSVAGRAGHFELITPGSTSWPLVVAAARALVTA